MLVQTHYPRKLSRARYDQYLASGWFRGSVMLYKMDLLSQSIMTLLFIVIQSQMKTHIQNIKEVLIIQFDSIVMTAFIIEYIVVA